ncbi:MAG: MarR family winged helix-turn-helix transcriptional regulator [Beijerinckiaceae bacterium]|nr:MarR family winged helix-turn-helix transcriptional regulator [Beijerinckiaceae bacterium]
MTDEGAKKQARRQTQEGDAFALDRFLPYQLSVAAEALSRLFARRYEEAFGIAVPEWRVIAVLGEGSDAGAQRLETQAIIDRTQMDAVRVSRACARLTAKGLVSRTVNPADQRAHVLALTARGHEVYASIAPMALDLERSLMAGLDAQERRTLEDLLAKIRTRAAQVAGGS